VKQLVDKYGPAPQPIVDVGGLERPCVADYQLTIDAMAKWREEHNDPRDAGAMPAEELRAAQMCRYLDIERPLSFLGQYTIENPEIPGGIPLERLAEKYHPHFPPKIAADGSVVLDPSPGLIGTAILLSVLEHVADPFEAIDRLRDAMALGGLAIVSVPFCFPFHPSPEDCWRFTPGGLRRVFSSPVGSNEPARWQILECDWRLDIPAEAGVLDIKTGRAQIIKSCYLAARAV
jgi:hypothetical protein